MDALQPIDKIIDDHRYFYSPTHFLCCPIELSAEYDPFLFAESEPDSKRDEYLSKCYPFHARPVCASGRSKPLTKEEVAWSKDIGYFQAQLLFRGFPSRARVLRTLIQKLKNVDELTDGVGVMHVTVREGMQRMERIWQRRAEEVERTNAMDRSRMVVEEDDESQLEEVTHEQRMEDAATEAVQRVKALLHKSKLARQATPSTRDLMLSRLSQTEQLESSSQEPIDDLMIRQSSPKPRKENPIAERGRSMRMKKKKTYSRPSAEREKLRGKLQTILGVQKPIDVAPHVARFLQTSNEEWSAKDHPVDDETAPRLEDEGNSFGPITPGIMDDDSQDPMNLSQGGDILSPASTSFMPDSGQTWKPSLPGKLSSNKDHFKKTRKSRSTEIQEQDLHDTDTLNGLSYDIKQKAPVLLSPARKFFKPTSPSQASLSVSPERTPKRKARPPAQHRQYASPKPSPRSKDQIHSGLTPRMALAQLRDSPNIPIKSGCLFRTEKEDLQTLDPCSAATAKGMDVAAVQALKACDDQGAAKETKEEGEEIEESIRRCLGWTNDLLQQGRAALEDRGSMGFGVGIGMGKEWAVG